MIDRPMARPQARALRPADLAAACPDARRRRLPEGLDAGLLARRHGPLLGRLLLWTNRARVRHQLARLAREAPQERFEDIGVRRARIAQEAARWFWQEMELP